MHDFIGRINAFLKDRRGNFAIMYALTGSVLLLATTMTIDVSRMFAIHSKLSFAVDAAVLATTQGLTLGDIALEDADTTLRKYLDANLDGRNLDADSVEVDSITVDKDARTVEVVAHATVPTTMAGIVGYNSQEIDVTSKAKYANTLVEVVMALDITGSMGSKISTYSTQTKLAALKSSAKLGVQTLFEDEATWDRVRIGLVPYSEAVNAAPVIDSIETTGVTKYTCSWTGYYYYSCGYTTTYPDCVRERTGTEKYTDTFANSTAKIGSSDYDCPSSEIVPMTNDQTSLESVIDGFSAGGCTAGHIPIAWAYYMLSSKWNSAWPEGSDAAEFDDAETRKYAIIMTDGEFNTFESNGYYCSSAGTSMSEDYALGLCDQMKDDGIKIYSIAFAAGSSAESLMKSCASTASSKQYYYNATDEDALQDAFLDIARDIKGLRLVN